MTTDQTPETPPIPGPIVCETPPLDPPNGHAVSNAELYKALYTLDQRLGERDTALLTLIGGVRTDFSNHAKDGHPWNQQAERVREEIKLDAAKAGVAAKWLSLGLVIAGAVVGLIVSIAKGWLGLA